MNLEKAVSHRGRIAVFRMTGCLTAACIALIALAGCAGGSSPKTNFYTLSVEARPERAGASAGTPSSVTVSRAAIPGLVDRPQIVARVASNSVEIFDFHRWAEPLPEAIARVIAGNLALQLGPRYTVAAGIVPGVPPDVRVSLDVQRFEAATGATGASVTVEALWSVRPTASAPLAGRSLIEERAGESGHAGIAAAYSRALARVAQDIAAAIVAEPVAPVTRPSPSRP